MYELPTLLEIGEGMTTIQGLTGGGDDLDGHFVVGDLEFGEDLTGIPGAGG